MTLIVAACSAAPEAETTPARRTTKGDTETNDGSPETTPGGASLTPSPASDAGPDAGQPGPRPPLGPVKQGIATFYEADGSGNCSFPPNGDMMFVAPNKAWHYAGSAACGSCLKVTGSKGSVVVRVTDSCPVDTPDNDCGDTHADLDLSAQAFAQIESPSVGIANVSFQVVPCEVTGPMKYRFKDGSSQWWTAIQIRNHRVPIAKVEYASGGSFVTMAREDDNYFVQPSGVGAQPQGLLLRITSSDGQVVEELLPGIDDAQVLTGTKQFL